MSNLIDLVKEQFSSGVVDKVSTLLGTQKHETNSALEAFIPTILSGIVEKGSTESGARSLMDFIGNKNLGSGVLDDVGDLLAGGLKTDSFLKIGGQLLSTLFGSNTNSLLDQLLTIGKLNRGITNKLLSIIGPIALSAIGKLVKSENLNVAGLISYLTGQKSIVNAALPAGLSAFSSVDHSNASQSKSDDEDSGGGMGWLKWLILILLLALVLWYFLGRPGCVNTSQGEDKKAGQTEQQQAEEGDQDKTIKKLPTVSNLVYRIDRDGNIIDPFDFIVYKAIEVKKDKDGNIVDGDGEIIIAASEIEKATTNIKGKISPLLSVDKEGNLVGVDGKILFKKGEFTTVDGYYLDKEGNKIGFFKKIGKAIGDAAEATAEAFKDVFTGIFSKADKVGTTYKISRMDFNQDDHRLSYYSKPEFEGLVAAVKDFPDRKLQVRVYTDDGKNENENQKLSDLRANVVRDMMATLLGTNKNQISFKGMGSKDAAKASSDVVEVFVEK
jgi:outer membrane protein OmpA-like peptidoglycan-associated protein